MALPAVSFAPYPMCVAVVAPILAAEARGVVGPRIIQLHLALSVRAPVAPCSRRASKYHCVGWLEVRKFIEKELNR